MGSTSVSDLPKLGFLTVFHEANGYVGGYLVTNIWGRPLEFRLSSPVQPNRVQQILYGGSLQPYVCADLIGKTLLEKTGTPAQLIVTDREPVLELRLTQETPVIWLAKADDPLTPALAAAGAAVGGVEPNTSAALFCHPRFLGDLAAIRDTLGRLDGSLDLTEPFARIRDAIGEARKMGVAARA